MMQIETRSIDYVPAAERHGRAWHLWPVWFASGTQLATVATGVIGTALGADLLWSGFAILSGCALGTFFMAFHAAQGPQLGLPQMIQSRPQFGYVGALLVWIIALISYLGYNAFNEALAGDTAYRLAGLPAGHAGTAFTVIALGISVVGYDLIHAAQRWLSYLLIAVLSLFTIGACVHLRFAAAAWVWAPFPRVPFLTQFFAAAAYQLSGAFYVSDYSRYLPRAVGIRAPFLWTYAGAFAGSAWTMLIGALAASMRPGLSIAGALQAAGDSVRPGYGNVLLGVALLGLLTMASLNYYGASLTALSVLDSVSPVRATRAVRIASLLLIGVVTHALAQAIGGRFVQGFSGLLAILLLLFTPWTAVNLVDFYFVRKSHYSIREIFNPRGLYGRWNRRGLSAYGIGFAAMLPFVHTELYEGPIARLLQGTDLSMPIGLIVAGGIYLWSHRHFDLDRERAQALRADHGLDAETCR
jgi:nucleobase:cation symporter-1, NCS1 family